MLIRLIARLGLRPVYFQGVSFGTIALCIGFWIRAKTMDQDERGNAERRALFVGLWPPMFWLIAQSLERELRRIGPFRRR